MTPVVILVNPQMGENIGAVARAMANFGLTELRLVAPRDGWPNPNANNVAAHAVYILEAAKIYPDFRSALEGIHIAYATTGRPRDLEKQVVEPAEAMADLIKKSASAARCALVFGPERTGLTNEDIVLCDVIVNIPTAPDYRSLNIAQSSVVMFYEWFKAAGGKVDAQRDLPEPAPKEEWLGLFGQLEGYLDQAEFFRVADKKPVMWQNIQNMLLRGKWTDQEIRTLRGVLRSLWERRRG